MFPRFNYNLRQIRGEFKANLIVDIIFPVLFNTGFFIYLYFYAGFFLQKGNNYLYRGLESWKE